MWSAYLLNTVDTFVRMKTAFFLILIPAHPPHTLISIYALRFIQASFSFVMIRMCRRKRAADWAVESRSRTAVCVYIVTYCFLMIGGVDLFLYVPRWIRHSYNVLVWDIKVSASPQSPLMNYNNWRFFFFF